FISENSDAAIESFSPSPIFVEDSDSIMEETDLTLTLDDSMPPGIEDDEYDSKRDILILEEFLSIDSLSFPKNEDDDFHLQHHVDHQEDDAPPEGEKRVKRHKTSKRSKSKKGSSSKQSAKIPHLMYPSNNSNNRNGMHGKMKQLLMKMR
nr:hypothetical protein [Tanacetum cinerariifolium]